MKKLFFMLIALFVVYLTIQFAFTFFSKGSTSDYIIKGNDISFGINEDSYFKDDMNFYSFTIEGNNSFKFQINYNFGKASQVIQDIKYYRDDNYECILPIFKNHSILMDILCYGNGKYTFYYNLKGSNKNLDNFVLSLSEYKLSQFTDIAVVDSLEGISVYKNNLIQDHYIAINNYKGIYDVSSNFNSIVYNISLYKKDIYNPKLTVFADEYFVSVDYDKEHDFNKINIVNLTKLDTHKITSDNAISMDSYIQGVVDGKVYLFDKDNKIQYEINAEKGTITSYANNMKYYDNGTWKELKLSDANKGILFNYGQEELNGYSRVDKVGNETGYYYMYKKNKDTYDVYRRSIKEETAIYLFSTKTIDSISYVDNCVYYVDGNILKVYKDEFGVKKVLQYKELEFNTNLKINVYSK